MYFCYRKIEKLYDKLYNQIEKKLNKERKTL